MKSIIKKANRRKNHLKNRVSEGKMGFYNSHEHGDAGGIIFIDFGENKKNRFFSKNSVLDITHHLRGATEFSWGQ